MNLKEYTERMAQRIAQYEDEIRQSTEAYVAESANITAEFLGDAERVLPPKDPSNDDDVWNPLK